MKKFLTAALAALMIISLAGCGCGSDVKTDSSSQTSLSTQTDSEESSSISVSYTDEGSDEAEKPTSSPTPTVTPTVSTAPEATPEPTTAVTPEPEAPSQTEPNDIVYFVFNCGSVSDWRVRAALTLSVNRGGFASPAYGIVADNVTDSSGYNFEDGAPYPGNIYSILSMMYPEYDFSDYASCCSAAQSLFNEAVSEGAFDPSSGLELVMNTDIGGIDAGSVAATWGNLFQTNVNVTYVSGAQYDSALASGNFSAIAYRYPAAGNDLLSYFNLFTTGGIAPSFSSGLYDGFVSDAANTSDGMTRDSFLLSAEQVLFDAGGFPCAPVCNL